MGDAESQITKNCHYISRFLTKPWEFDDRRLWYYDFDSDTFDRASSKSLFAEDEINSPEVEAWIKRTLEDPLALARPQLMKADPQALDDWRFFRAAVLMIWLQGFRAHSVEGFESRRHLDEIARLPEGHLDTFAQMIGRDFTLRLVFTVWDDNKFYPLAVPSQGTFVVTAGDAGCMCGISLGVGLPLDPRCALVALPVEERGKLDLSLLPGSLANHSVGIAPSRLVVLHPDVRTLPEERLRRDLRECRQNNDTLTSSVHEMRKKVVETFAALGIIVGRDGVGRIIKPT